MTNWTTADIPDQSGRLAVVTGANSGLGAVTAKELARAGARVIVACRNTSKGDQAAAGIRSEVPTAQLDVRALDLADLDSVRAFAERVSAEESDNYFAGRPRESQIGAWASQQSQPLASRDVLEARIREVEGRFGGGTVSRPPFWGGFRIVPRTIEFWHGRIGRLHERLLYTKEGNRWKTNWLFP